jgi:cation diffusion facilitator family transporter
VISEGIHSSLDLVSAAVAFFTIRVAGKPADEEHPFGHGKIETLSSLLESLLLVAAAGWIIYEAVDHILHPHPIEHAGIAIATIALSLVVSLFVYRDNIRAARITESSAIEVNALHFLSDVIASAGILAGLVLLKLTGWWLTDPILALGVALYILAMTASQIKRALEELADTQLPAAEVAAIREVVDAYRFKGTTIEAHDLRTRRSGSTRHVDFHLVVCRKLTVLESHAKCDAIEARIQERFPGASVNIHVEPCGLETGPCDQRNCPV